MFMLCTLCGYILSRFRTCVWVSSNMNRNRIGQRTSLCHFYVVQNRSVMKLFQQLTTVLHGAIKPAYPPGGYAKSSSTRLRSIELWVEHDGRHQPITMGPKYWRLCNQFTSTRYRRWTVGGLFFIPVFYFIFWGQHSRVIFDLKGFTSVDLDWPPTYQRLKQWENNLPQHNLDLPFPEGRTGRYVLFKNQITGLGWNNELNEV